MSSAETNATKAKPIPLRKPINMNGTTDGMMILRKTANFPRPKNAPVRKRSMGISLAPTAVLIVTTTHTI